MRAFLVFIRNELKKTYLNCIGRYHKTGGCPNCGDQWNWKSTQLIPFRYAAAESRSGLRAVSICTECLARPERIHLSTIKRNLLKQDWPADEARLAIEAINDSIEEPQVA